MGLALHSLSVYNEIIAHANLNIMTKLTDNVTNSIDKHLSGKEQSEALHRALLSNTEVKLLERKTKLVTPCWK